MSANASNAANCPTFSLQIATMNIQLRGGHTQAVLSIDVATDGSGRIISGAENSELCLWSPDGDVLENVKIQEECDVSSVCFSTEHPHSLYTAAGKKIHVFDLRSFREPVEEYDFNEDEINQIVINKQEKYLAACDDSGQVKVINLDEKKLYRTLRKHTNVCATVSFRPNRDSDLLSGAYDCKIIQWDFARVRSVCTMSMQDFGTAGEAVGSPMLTPPFVHSLALSNDGGLMAVGTENALVEIFDASKRTLSYRETFRRHTQGVCQVHFPVFNDGYLMSGGNDGNIFLWDMTQSSGSGITCNGLSHGKPGSEEVVPKFTIDHCHKVNWISSGMCANRKFFVVADNTCDPMLYAFPE